VTGLSKIEISSSGKAYDYPSSNYRNVGIIVSRR
jgi:hypothetical protein